MKEATKQEIMIILDLLKKCLIKNGVSMGVEFKGKEILFFDTENYLSGKGFSGFVVKVDDLVK